MGDHDSFPPNFASTKHSLQVTFQNLSEGKAAIEERESAVEELIAECTSASTSIEQLDVNWKLIIT
jgi:chaperonin cofactor prefoldin